MRGRPSAIRLTLVFGLCSTLAVVVSGCRPEPKGPPTASSYADPDDQLDMTQAEVRDKLTPQTHFAAAQLAESQGRLEQAIDQYRAALRVEAGHAPSLYALARLHTLSKQFAQAIPAWERYVRATDDSPAAWNNLAKCYELAGQWADAEASYVRALQRNPGHSQTTINYGLMLAQRDRLDEAETVLSRVLPEAAAQYNIASVCELRGRHDQAKARYQEALRLDPTLTEAEQRLALIDSR